MIEDHIALERIRALDIKIKHKEKEYNRN